MKQTIILTLAFLAAGIMCADAQVTIGENRNPHTGAVLDLNTNSDTNKKGFLLPQVELLVADSWDLDGDAIAGMMVFNKKATADLPIGVYVWDGTAWKSASNSSGNSGNGGNGDIPDPIDPGTPPSGTELAASAAYIMGPTCYDVVQTNFGGSCGAKDGRTATFSEEADRTRTYSLVFTNSTGRKDMRIGYYNDADGIIKTIKGGKNGLLGQKTDFTVVFADNINELAAGRDEALSLTVTLFAQFKEGDETKHVELKLRVMDCQCCPGTVIASGVWVQKEEGHLAPATTTMDVLKTYFHNFKQDLCVRQAHSIGQVFAQATITCENTQGWRLPTIAELGDIQQKAKDKMMQVNNYHWSTTSRANGSNWVLSNAGAVNWYGITSAYGVVCVRTTW